jgi:hypothetical protein
MHFCPSNSLEDTTLMHAVSKASSPDGVNHVHDVSCTSIKDLMQIDLERRRQCLEKSRLVGSRHARNHKEAKLG